MFQYVRQPSSTTIQGCDPYDQDGRIRIRLQCAVKVHNNFTLEIRWFQENTVGEVVNLGRGQPDNLISLPFTMFSEAVSIYHNNKLLGNQYNSSFLGKYWCQVINTTADSDQPLMRSNVFTLLPPDNYTKPTCLPSVQFINNVTCADLTSDSDDDQTSLLPVPVTTTATFQSAALSSAQDQQSISNGL